MTSIGVIDIGTNTTRILIRDTDVPDIDVVRMTRVTRLGSALEETNELSRESMDATLSALHDYISIAQSHGTIRKNILIFATAAARSADNGAAFIAKVEEEIGCRAVIISGEQEGKAAYRGALEGFNDNKPSVVFDIGGGSTEFATSSSFDNQCDLVQSIPIGSVRLTKRYLHSDPPLPEELTNALNDVREQLVGIKDTLGNELNLRRWIGVAATVTTTAAIELGLAKFDATCLHGLVMNRNSVEEIFRTLASETLEDRLHNPGLAKERADVIVGGLIIIVSIMRFFELSEITVSCKDLLDGLWHEAVILAQNS